MPFQRTTAVYEGAAGIATADEERGVLASRTTRDAGPNEVRIKLVELNDRSRVVTIPARVELAISGNPVTYIFDQLIRYARDRIRVTHHDGTIGPMSLEECKAILSEAVPILELNWQQCGENAGLVVHVVFSEEGPNDSERPVREDVRRKWTVEDVEKLVEALKADSVRWDIYVFGETKYKRISHDNSHWIRVTMRRLFPEPTFDEHTDLLILMRDTVRAELGLK